jgi:glycosyltransferase involved in cell wall biosynthesis
MALDIPVVAYAAGCAETMGEAGVLLQEWDVDAIAAQMHRLLRDQRWRSAEAWRGECREV